MLKKKFDTNLFKYDILYISISIIFYNKPTILRKSVMKENLVWNFESKNMIYKEVDCFHHLFLFVTKS